MKIPIRPTSFEYSTKWPKSIVIHHTEELQLKDGSVKMSRSNFQFNSLVNSYYQLSKVTTPPYHYVIDFVKDDYYIHVCRPLMTKCIFEDLPEEYDESIHIALLGDYSADIVSNRLYTVLASKLLSPFMRLFRIKEDNIFTHNEISNSDNISCPGEYFNKEKMIMFLRNHIRKTVVNRA